MCWDFEKNCKIFGELDTVKIIEKLGGVTLEKF